MGLFIEGGTRVSEWEVKAAEAQARVAAEWETMEMQEILGALGQVWGIGEVLPPENTVVEIARPDKLLVDVHGSELRQHLIINDPQDGQVRSRFTLNLRYTPSQTNAPFSIWVEDAQRRPDDDHALRAGRMDGVVGMRGTDMDYTREVSYHPLGRVQAREQVLRYVSMAIKARIDRGLLPGLSVPTSARRVA